MLQDVSTTATLPIRNYDSIKRHIFSIRSTLCAVSRREPSILPTDLVSSRNRFKASMIYAVSTQRITIRNVIHFYLPVIENTFYYEWFSIAQREPCKYLARCDFNDTMSRCYVIIYWKRRFFLYEYERASNTFEIGSIYIDIEKKIGKKKTDEENHYAVNFKW